MPDPIDTSEMPNFSITAYGKALEDKPSASDWLFGNPLRDILNVGTSPMEPGIVVANKNWNAWTDAQGALRTLGKTIEDGVKKAQENKNLLAIGGVVLGVVVLAKVLKRR